MIWLLIATLGCRSADPVLVAQREAVDAWREGTALLEKGDPEAARARFRAAQDKRPADVLLLAWEARAAAEAGDLEEAIVLLDRVLKAHPDFAEARYNRAAYKARAGAPADEVARDLQRALQEGVTRPRDVLSDPDFEAYLDEPALGFLPESRLTVAVDAPEASVFWGSLFDVRLRVIGADGEPVAIDGAVPAGVPIELVSVVEDEVISTEGPQRDLTWTFRVAGAGTHSLGPITVSAGRHRATVEPIALELAAPPGREAPAALAARALTTPRALAEGLEPPAAVVRDGRLLVLARPNDDLRLPDGAVHLDREVRYEYRERGRPQWVLRALPLAREGPLPVEILRQGRSVLEVTLGG